MATFAKRVDTITELRLRDRVRVAIVKQALEVWNEATSVTYHAQRLLLAEAVLAEAGGYVERFVYGVLAVDDANSYNDNVAGDTALLTQVAALWDEFSPLPTGP